MLRLLPLLALLSGARAANDTCPPAGAAHVVVARASDEAPGFGIIGAVSDQVVSMLPGSSQEAVAYPASFDNYFASQNDGVFAMKGLLKQFAADCPHSAIVCMGYSQGAQVVADSLIGTDDKFIPADGNATVNGTLPQSVLDQVAAVILMGDPSHVPGLGFDVGNSTLVGVFPRQNSELFNKTGLTPKIQSYCDFNDTYCASGNSSAVHDGYVQEYGSQAAKFVVDKVKAWTANATASIKGTATASAGAAPSGTASSSSSSPSSQSGDAAVLAAGQASWTALVGLVGVFALGLAL